MRKSMILQGAFAGLLATGPMSLAMWLLKRSLPKAEQYPLPPRQITEELLDKAGADQMAQKEEAVGPLTAIAHFGYGAAAGALFGFLYRQRPNPPLLSGPLFGMAVWTASYLGWLPAFSILPAATEHPERRNWLMITAHLIWGLSLVMSLKSTRRNLLS